MMGLIIIPNPPINPNVPVFQAQAAASQAQIEQLLGKSLANPLEVAVFKSDIRKWMLANHPDKNPAEIATDVFKRMVNLIDRFKAAQSQSGVAGWNYK